jgi:translation initiation factor 1
MLRKHMNTGVVYSTEHGRMCPECGKPAACCSCSKKQPVQKSDGIVWVKRETKGRKGKGVTIITGLSLDQDRLLDLAKQLKQHCSSGGTVKDGVIEIQGDHRTLLVQALTKQGYAVRTA